MSFVVSAFEASRRMSRGPIRILLPVLCGLWLAGGVPILGDTIVLKDGTKVEGKIDRETARLVVMETETGRKSFLREDIEKILRGGEEGGAFKAIQSTKDFAELDDLGKQLKNAEALYALGRFDELPPMVKPLIGKGTKSDDMRIRWMLIETAERQARWGDAEALLKKTLEDGTDQDKLRAQAHLDIFEENPGYTLRKIGGRRTIEFLERDMRNRGKLPNALQDPAIMDAALKEYLDQILRNEKISVYALRERMDLNETYNAILEAIDKGTRPIVSVLPYTEDLEKVRHSIERAGAVVPGAARGFEVDLVRTELNHLHEVIGAMLSALSEAYPADANVGADQETGRLTKEGREQWRQLCDQFLRLADPTTEMIKYLLYKARQFPDELHPLIKEWEDTLERVEQMKQNTVRNYDRTHV